MAHYVIGDVQGCFEELLDLTKLIEFSSINDRLIFAGDLVNSCLLYTSPSPRDRTRSRMPSSA